MNPIGVVYPHNEIETDAGAVREYAQAVEAMGYAHVLLYDHVIGANTRNRPGWQGPYTIDTLFHEPLVQFAYMAGATKSLGFVTGILILSQRQTVLVARQAASLDILCEGRLRIGVGTGWNHVEYEALNIPFKGRGARIDEQIDVLKLLWSQREVTFRGRDHTIIEAGLNPMPIQQPIPIWLGGGGDRPAFGTVASSAVHHRIASKADGWIPMFAPEIAPGRPAALSERSLELIDTVRGLCREYGRDPAALGIEGRCVAARKSDSHWGEAIQAWRDVGASHLSVDTMHDGLFGVQQHLRRMEEFARVAFT